MVKEKLIYAVQVLRQDNQHISILESVKYEDCYARWKVLQQEWTAASKEQRPFVLEDPIVTAFNPAMIYEIRIAPLVTTTEEKSETPNPYAQRMQQQGFGKTFPSASGIDLLSR